MKWMLLFALIAGPGHAHPHNPQTHKAYGITGNKQQPRPILPVVETTIEPVRSPNNSNTKQEAPKWKRDDPQWWSLGVNTGLAIITLFTLLLLHNQVKAIRNTERAFLIPQWNNETWINPKRISCEEAPCCFVWRFKNCGKTPAFIEKAVGTLVLIDTIHALRKKPIYEKSWIYYGDPLVPGGLMEGGPFIAELDDDRPYDAIQDEYRREKKVLFAYGYVRYKDMFGKSHETRFSVRMAVGPHSILEDQFVIAGPKAYNRYT